jgi:tetratricopeptide (TPR) repeat protein
MVKDVNYYHTETSFGVKGIGYTKDVVGGGDAVAPKGKYKSSGYGDMPKTKVVKEGLNESTESMDFSAKDQKDWSEQKSKMYDVWVNKSNELVDLKDDLKKAKNRNDKDEVKRINNKILQKQIAIKTAKEKFQKLSESLNEAKKSNVHSRIKDLEKQNEVLALESKITALEEAINELTQKVSLSESDDLAEMMDPKKINELKKDIKVLEKYKMTCEKKLSKLGGKKEIVDEVVTGENPYFDTDPSDGDADEDNNMKYGAENYYDKGQEAFNRGDLEKAQEYYEQALKFGSYLGWTERELPPYKS